MRRTLFGMIFLCLASWAASAAEASYSMSGGRFSFPVPDNWTLVARELRGPREYLGFLVDDRVSVTASRILVGVFSFCLDYPRSVEGFIGRLKEESRDQFRFRLKWEGPALGRYQGYFYTAQPWREEFLIADYYLSAGDCGLQVRFAVPSQAGDIGGFEVAMTGFLDALQVAMPKAE